MKSLYQLLVALSVASGGPAHFETAIGISLSVQPDGTYSITSRQPAWTFGGNANGPLSHIKYDPGNDSAGTYHKISFNITLNGSVAAASIRAYDRRPVVVFSITLLSDVKNSPLFPLINTYPKGLYKFGFRDVYSYQYGPSGQGPDSPWAYFDSSGDTFIISPASHFPIAAMTVDQNQSIAAGIHPAIQTLPAGFTQETMLAVGKGINRTWDEWGLALTALQGKVRRDARSDVTLSALSYWTDSASTYYYNFVASLGYEGTLRAVQKDFASHGIPIRSMQLDSWWYPKGDPPAWNNTGDGVIFGQYMLRPDPTILPDGLSGLQSLLHGIPLLVHARWFEPDSPIRTQYQMSGNVPIDPKYWADLATYLASNGVMTYEQDWLASYAQPNFNLTDPEAYLDEMAQAMDAARITMQFCGHYVGQLMQGSKYGNLTTARVSPDGFNTKRWDAFLYNSRLTSALGILPFADNVYSADIKSLLLETHSAGIVGIADAIGTEVADNISQAIRPDGFIVKPDTPILPLDSTYIADALAQANQAAQPPMLATSYSHWEREKVVYVFAYSRAADGSAVSIAFTPQELGIGGPAYVYDYFSHHGELVAANSSFTAAVTASGSYFVVAPVGRSGIALLGDAHKFVTAGRQRIPQMTDTGVLNLTVEFAEGEAEVTIQGYSEAFPVVTVTSGAVHLVKYDRISHVFSADVTPAPRADTASFSLSVR